METSTPVETECVEEEEEEEAEEEIEEMEEEREIERESVSSTPRSILSPTVSFSPPSYNSSSPLFSFSPSPPFRLPRSLFDERDVPVINKDDPILEEDSRRDSRSSIFLPSWISRFGWARLVFGNPRTSFIRALQFEAKRWPLTKWGCLEDEEEEEEEGGVGKEEKERRRREREIES